jgi:hypothetical protein
MHQLPSLVDGPSVLFVCTEGMLVVAVSCNSTHQAQVAKGLT